jgi:hypothetical protein
MSHKALRDFSHVFFGGHHLSMNVPPIKRSGIAPNTTFLTPPPPFFFWEYPPLLRALPLTILVYWTTTHVQGCRPVLGLVLVDQVNLVCL